MVLKPSKNSPVKILQLLCSFCRDIQSTNLHFVQLKLNNENITKETEIYHDSDSSNDASQLSFDTITFFVKKCGDQYALRVKDSEADTLKNFKGNFQSF